ncbi:hypothetical protein KGM48_01320 [Patescibacteria group bacterium]|nr:hypothetical protein [Patescibacteria group bacterium]
MPYYPDDDKSLYISPTVGISISLILLVVGGGLGALTSWYLSKPAIAPECSTAELNQKYQSGFEAAKQLVENSSIGGAFRPATDVRTLTGTVTSVSADRFTLNSPSVNPFDDQSMNIRTVFFSGTTTIVALIPKDPVAYQKEMDVFVRSARLGTSTPLNAPSSTTEIAKKTADIKVGDAITVIAAENIRSLKEFPADKIEILIPSSLHAPLP